MYSTKFQEQKTTFDEGGRTQSCPVSTVQWYTVAAASRYYSELAVLTSPELQGGQGSPVLWHTAQVSWLVESRILCVSGKLKWTLMLYVVRKMLCIPRYASSLFHPDSSTIFSLSLSLVYNVLIIFRGDTFSGLTDPKIQILSTPSQSDGWPTNLLSLLRRDGRHLRHGVQRHGSRLRNCEVRDWWVEMWKELTDSVHVMSICYVMVQILWWRSRDMSNMIEPFWQNLCSVMWARVSKVALLFQ